MRTSLLKLLSLLFAFALVGAACGSGSDDASDDGGSDDSTQSDDGGSSDDSGDDGSGDDGSDGDTVDLTQGGGTLAEVQARGTLNCGVSGQSVAFSAPGPDGSLEGMDVDYCKVVAAAVLGDSEAINYVQLTAAERFTAVQTGEVDLLMRNSTWTQSRDTEVGMDFGPTTYYDGQQLMGRASAGFSGTSSVAEIDGAIVCTNAGSTTETNIAELASELGITITLNTFEGFNDVMEAYNAGTCDVVTTDGSGLVGQKAVGADGADWVIFPPTPISKEPLGPVYGQNDSQWADVVNWAVYATIIADEAGVSSGTVDAALAGDNPEMVRVLGGDGELQSAMGLSADAFYNVISQVGNYSEIFERNLGPVGLVREGSANAAWTEGGLIYAPPAR